MLAGSNATGSDAAKGILVDDESGGAWLVRPVSINTVDFGVVAVDLGRRSELFDDLRARVVALISDAGTLPPQGAINSSGGITLTATSNSFITSAAQGGAKGGVAVVPVAALTLANMTTSATVNGTGALNAAGPVSLSATHTGFTMNTATGKATGTQDGRIDVRRQKTNLRIDERDVKAVVEHAAADRGKRQILVVNQIGRLRPRHCRRPVNHGDGKCRAVRKALGNLIAGRSERAVLVDEVLERGSRPGEDLVMRAEPLLRADRLLFRILRDARL